MFFASDEDVFLFTSANFGCILSAGLSRWVLVQPQRWLTLPARGQCRIAIRLRIWRPKRGKT